VLTKNTRKSNKFDPTYGPELMKIISTEEDGATCEDQHGRHQRRQADDIKIVNVPENTQDHVNNAVQPAEDSEIQRTDDIRDKEDAQEETDSSPRARHRHRQQGQTVNREVSMGRQQTSSAENAERRYPLRNRKPNPKYSNNSQ